MFYEPHDMFANMRGTQADPFAQSGSTGGDAFLSVLTSPVAANGALDLPDPFANTADVPADDGDEGESRLLAILKQVGKLSSDDEDDAAPVRPSADDDGGVPPLLPAAAALPPAPRSPASAEVIAPGADLGRRGSGTSGSNGTGSGSGATPSVSITVGQPAVLQTPIEGPPQLLFEQVSEIERRRKASAQQREQQRAQPRGGIAPLAWRAKGRRAPETAEPRADSKPGLQPLLRT